ncbi:acetate permease, partial [Burkholderia thailandensis]|nr:acetate permease [Burkholderia thailandensis]
MIGRTPHASRCGVRRFGWVAVCSIEAAKCGLRAAADRVDTAAEAPKHRSTEAPKHRSTEAPKHRSTEAPKHRSTEAPKHRSTEAPT